MAWLFAGVVLLLLVISAKFRFVAAGLAVVVVAVGAIGWLASDMERRASRTRIAVSELSFKDVDIELSSLSHRLSGRVTNGSAHHSLKSVEIQLSAHDCSGPRAAELQSAIEEILLERTRRRHAEAEESGTAAPSATGSWRDARVVEPTIEERIAAGRELRRRGRLSPDGEAVVTELERRYGDALQFVNSRLTDEVRLSEHGNCVTIGEDVARAYVNVPPSQARNFNMSFYFSQDSLAPRGRLVWTWRVVEAEGDRS